MHLVLLYVHSFVPERGKANSKFTSTVDWLLLFISCSPGNTTNKCNQDCDSYSKRLKKKIVGFFWFVPPPPLKTIGKYVAGQIIQNSLFFLLLYFIFLLLYFIFLQCAVKIRKYHSCLRTQKTMKLTSWGTNETGDCGSLRDYQVRPELEILT